MSFSVQRIDYRSYPVRMQEFKTSPTQPIGRYLHKSGRKLATLARSSAPVRSGALKKSIKVLRYNRGPIHPSIEVGATVHYAYYVHEGTNPHVIKSKPGKTLQFEHNGRIIYAKSVKHPGVRPNKFLSKHLYESIQ